MINPKWTLEQIAQWTNGKVISKKQTDFSEMGTDTRTDLTQKVFISLKGDLFDAHDFLDTAVNQGAGLLIVHRLDSKFENLKDKVSIIQVEDTLKALQDFSHCYRQTLKAKIIGITGSNGKTTTKEYTAQILNEFKKTHFNKGSFNNHWGVPMTLLQIPHDAEFAILEMGMNHAGEISQLVKIANPDVVVCTMVGHAHIEFFGTIQKIAAAKSEIYMDSREDCIRVFNQDQDLTFDMMYPVSKKFPASRMLSFSSKNKDCDVYFKIDEIDATGLKISGQIGSIAGSANVPIFGQHNLVNLMAAANLAYAVGMPVHKIWKALPLCKSTWGRNQFIQTHTGVQVLFDGYNANPDSMKALLENIPLVKTAGKKIGVFGQMKELGSQAQEMHFELGKSVALSGFDHVYFIGQDYESFEKGLISSRFQNYVVAPDLTEIMGQSFINRLKSGDFVVIKGSRGAKTERFVELCDPRDWTSRY